MIEIEVVGWLPISIPLRIPDLPSPPDFENCLEEFSFGLSSVLKTLHPAIVQAKTKITNPSKSISTDLRRLNSQYYDPQRHKFLQLKCVVAYDANEMTLPEDRDREATLRGFAACDLAHTLEDALLLAQLSFPTRIHSAVGRTYLGQYPMNQVSPAGGIYAECLWDPSIKWPQIVTVPIEKVAEWERKLGLFQQGRAKTPVQRALAAFTHLVGNKSIYGGETLFWAMQGLEAFYCRGTGDLRRQLSEKSRLFLGPSDGLKNIVGSLYDFRSRFVHGDYNLERWNNDLEWLPEDKKDQESSYQAQMLATRLLLATLQKCAEECITSAEFEYNLKLTYG